MKLSVIIVNYNTKEYLKECIRSILSNLKGVGHEIIVVDNASHDRSVEMLNKEFPKIKLIKNKKNIGFGKACNQGFKLSKGGFIFLLNPDTRLIDDSIVRMIRFMEKNDILIAGPTITYEDGSIQHSAQPFPSLIFESARALGLRGKHLHVRWLSKKILKGYFFASSIREPKPTGWVSGGAMMIQRSVVDKKIFDEDYFMYYEDVDFCWRMKQKGVQTWFLPFAHIIHHVKGSPQKSSVEHEEFKSKLLFLKKSNGQVKYSIFLGFLFILTTIKLLFFTIFNQKGYKTHSVYIRIIRGETI